MIVEVGNGEERGGRFQGFGSLIRRKQVDSVHYRGHPQLARKLSVVDLVGIGNSFSIWIISEYDLIEFKSLKNLNSFLRIDFAFIFLKF